MAGVDVPGQPICPPAAPCLSLSSPCRTETLPANAIRALKSFDLNNPHHTGELSFATLCNILQEFGGLSPESFQVQQQHRHHGSLRNIGGLEQTDSKEPGSPAEKSWSRGFAAPVGPVITDVNAAVQKLIDQTVVCLSHVFYALNLLDE